MANLQVNQIRKYLQDYYVPFVDASDITETGENKDNHILSRAYAAYSVATLGNYEPQDVCVYITDEYEDNGIDLIYVDTISKKIWIVQSKFSLKGNKGVECGDIHKFIQGTEDLCNGEYNKWGEHETNLFSKNIRHFLGKTDSNNAMLETLNDSPDLFKYFNNGISILCKSFKKTAFGGSNTDLGIFDCENIQIVNGAQTVGTIGTFYKRPIEGSPNAEVFVKIISLEGAPEDFSTKQTIANNTQNKVEKKDFVSLCPIQLKLKEELRLDGINYHLKRGVDTPLSYDYNYTFDEAAVALAASQTEVNLSVQAKREVGKLWESLTAPPYTELFNAKLTPTRLKHILKINRAVKNELDSLYKIHTEARNKRILILGNIFITHLVMQEVEHVNLENKSLKIDNYINDNIIPLVKKYSDATIATVNDNYQNSNIPQLFRNFTKCRDIKIKVITSLDR